MRKYFFNEVITASIYLIFIAAVPFISVISQFFFDDRTMYLSYLVAGISMVYDHVVLFGESINKRLWIEGFISVIFTICIFVVACYKIIQILTNPNANIVPYGFWDGLFICFLGIIVMINLVEFILCVRHDFKTRFNTNTPQDNNLLLGARKV